MDTTATAHRPPPISPLTPLPKPPAAGITEAALSDKIADLAHLCGWVVAHWRTSMNRRGIYLTAVQYDAAGFPDLILVHPARQLLWFREVKANHRGKTGCRRPLEDRQEVWRRWLIDAGMNFDVWGPDDWPDIVASLSNGRAQVQ